MPARGRPTFPHSGPRPHREHRSDKGRREDHNIRRDRHVELERRKAELLEDELDEEIRDATDENAP